jgi:hypothetical protein
VRPEYLGKPRVFNFGFSPMVLKVGIILEWYEWGWNSANFDGVRMCLWTAATNRPVGHPPGDIWVWRATVERYWQGKPKNSENNLSQCHFAHHKSYRPQIRSWSPQGMGVLRQCKVQRAEVIFVTTQRENMRLSKKEMNKAVTMLKLPDVCS